MYPIVAPSILAADFSELAEQIKIVEDAGAKILHLDIMDGHFVPNISFGPEIVSTINKITNLPLDVHLMIDEPIRYISQFVKSGADNITIHVEACKDVLATLNEIKNQNIKASISLKPNTSVSQIEPYLNLVDMVLVMSVEPGFGGQSFIESSLEKVKEIKNINPKMIIEIDGGIDLANASRVVESGVHILVAGNAIFKSNDIAESFLQIQKNAEIKK
ncbi:MAG: ribulose-phosphate 3-epimerase [Bacteroidota bacterium]